MAEQNPSSQSTTEEDRALDELLAGEQEAGDGPADVARGDEQDEALEELLSGQASGPEAVKTDEDKALDDLATAQSTESVQSGSEAEDNPDAQDHATDGAVPASKGVVAPADNEGKTSGRGQDPSADDSPDDSIITLKEAVALGGVSAEETLSEDDEALDALMGAQESSSKQETDEQATEGMAVSGLSRAERDDLDKLIKGLKEDASTSVSPAVIADLQKQVRAMRKRVIQLTRLVSEYDQKMKACSEVMRLFYQKSEIMNERIDAISSSAKGGKKG
jgi:hypothetical protein